MKISISLLFTFFIISLSACAQPGYKIEVKIDGLKDTTILLGYHFGEKKFVADSAVINSNGYGVFQGDSLLPRGMYIIIVPQKGFFDILLGDNQTFSVSTNIDSIMESISFKGSPENIAFLGYQKFISEKQQRKGEMYQRMEEAKGAEDAEKLILDEIRQLDRDVKAFWDKTIVENQGTFLATIVSLLKPIEFPEFVIPEDATNPDSLRWIWSYHYNQNHYFDNFDFTEEGLIRTPFFQGRIDNYFDKVLLPIPDTVKLYAAKLIEATSKNPKMFQFMLSHLFSKYQNPAIMGMDAVFVHLAEIFYLSGRVPWINEEVKTKIADRVAELKPNLIGEIAPNLVMHDIDSKVIQLHSINAKLIVMYFWEPGCSHCKKSTPIILDIYKKYKEKGLEVFAVYTQGEIDKWKEYVTSKELIWINVWDPNRTTNYHKLYDIYSTPVLYVLDSDKKIIAKRIGHETLEKIIEEEFKQNP